MELVVGLLFAGVLFIAAEVFMPSGLIAALGGVCLVAGVGVTFERYNFFTAMAAGVGALLAAGLIVYVELKLLPHTSLGKKMFNAAASSGKAVDTGAATAPEMIGKQGKAATAFAPTGLAEIDGQKYEAACLDGFLHPGEALIVAGRDAYKLLVKKAPVV
jgi:membrane-bound serine protease (ClpP class)